MKPRWLARTLAAAVLLAGGACAPGTGPDPPALAGKTVEPAAVPEAEGPPLFEEITGRCGIEFTYRNGEEANHLTIFESTGGGVGVIDYDGDGLPDIFLPGGGTFTGKDKKDVAGLPCKLYRNLGGGKFRDVTAEVGLDRLAGGKPWFYTHGVAVADYNRDGWPDLLVAGWGRIALFRNVPDGKGGRRFDDVSAKAGLDRGVTWGVSAAWADLDGDGYPDLYVVQYVDWSWANNPTCRPGTKDDVCSPRRFSGLTHKVFRNNGGTFTDVSDTCGLVKGGPEASKGLGVLAIGLRGGGKPDLYVANDSSGNFLYLNRSVPGKIVLEECALASGVATDDRGALTGSMGVDAADYDGSGKPSLWVTNYEDQLHALYTNLSQGSRLFFRFRTTATGIAVIGQKYVGWGTAFVDFDLDGWEDLFVSHGHALRFPEEIGAPRRQKPVLLLNRGNGTFLPAGKLLGAFGQREYLGRGAAFVDLDNDGRVDVVLCHMNEPTAVLRNIAPKEHHWLGVELRGAGHADVVGARVVLEAAGRKQTRFARGGGSFASSSDRRLVFGLGKTSQTGRLTVIWPNGQEQHWTGLSTGRYHVLIQGEKAAQPYPQPPAR